MQIVTANGVRSAMVLVTLLFLPGHAFGGCSDAYPDTDVSARMARPDYAACSLGVMTTDYASILTEQARLLDLLRPAYRRHLQGSFEPAKQQSRLEEYKAKVAKLREIAATLASAGEDGPPTHGLLMRSKQLSQGLRSQISLARDGLETEESATYCKLDFHFRLRDALHRMLRACSQRGGGG